MSNDKILQTINNISWDQLKHQKTSLLEIQSKIEDTTHYEAIEGIINLIDSIQDSVETDGAAQWVNEVFN